MENTIKPHNPITYSIRIVKKKADFYTELDEFRNKLINTAKVEYFGAVSAYQNYVEENKIEEPRKWEEYFLEILMLGVFWNIYSPFISKRTRYLKFIFDGLYTIRKSNNALKPYADKFRGYLATSLLKKKYRETPAYDLKNIKLLLTWMDCTKEFIEEVKRLNSWVLFFKMNPDIFKYIQKTINDFADYFEKESKLIFGDYTNNVKKFLIETHPEYKNKENYFFTGRREVEYHLNMIGASILNHVLQEEFHKTKKQIVLLPSCMSSGRPCKAKKIGFELLCTHCDRSCKVSKITKELSNSGVKSVLIPHSSKFSDYLKLWANQKKTGLVGIACALILLRGGYELVDLGIPSQCVFLDHCGCKKHWSKNGIPTDINYEQLRKLLNIDKPNIESASM